MHTETANSTLLVAADVTARYRITKMTLWRWENDPALGFPRAIRIRNRRYWVAAELNAFDRRMREKRTGLHQHGE